MSDFILDAQVRSDRGKAAIRRLRLTDKVPAVVYGAEKEPMSLILDQKQVSKALENEAVFSSILTLKIDGNAEKVIIKALERHASKPKTQHLDFFRISAKEKLTMIVPLHFTGAEESPGINEGGAASHLLTEVEIKCLPADLPKFIEVSIAKLGMDESIHLSQITLPKGVELTADLTDDEHDHAIVSVHIPKIIEEPEPEPEVLAEGEEGAEAAEEGAETEAGEGEQAKPAEKEPPKE